MIERVFRRFQEPFLYLKQQLIYYSVLSLILKSQATQFTMKFMIQIYDPNESKTKKTFNQFKPKPQQQFYFYSLYYPNLKVFCDICFKEITKITRIAISEKVDYCVDCFANFKDPYPESYHVIKSLRTQITQSKWTAQQELLFLNLIEKWGFGSWGQIKNHMNHLGCNFTVSQLKRHFQKIYNKQSDAEDSTPRLNQNIFEPQPGNDKYEENNESQLQQQSQIVHNFTRVDKSGWSINNNITGYNPKRGDFEIQYNNEAEAMLGYLQFRDDDTPQETQLKFKIIDSYNKCLDERIKRKQFVLNHRLLDTQYQKQLQLSRNKYEKEAALQLKPFSRFSTLQQHNQLISRLAFSNKLKSLIQGLRKCRKIDKQGTLQSVTKYLEKKRADNGTTPKGRPRKLIHFDSTYKKGKNLQSEQDNILMQHIGMKRQQIQILRQKIFQMENSGQMVKIGDFELTLLTKNTNYK